MVKLLTRQPVRGYPAHVLVDSAQFKPGEMRRLFTLGVLARATTKTMREAAQARGLPGWHNMKYETLLERLDG